jgi:hypothetical protein
MIGDPSHHAWANLVAIMECKDEIGRTGPLQYPV